MLIDLQAHYLDLIVQALEAAGHGCLLRKNDEVSGRIFVTYSAESTKSAAVLGFRFDADAAVFGIEFRDQRPPVRIDASYHDGLDEFFPKLLKALIGNRLEDRRAA